MKSIVTLLLLFLALHGPAMEASVCSFSRDIAMVYAGGGYILGGMPGPHRVPSKAPACPIRAAVEGNALVLSSATPGSVAEYAIFDDAGNVILSGIVFAGATHTVNLPQTEQQGEFVLEVRVDENAYVGQFTI
jgi:hypothetical protein